MALIGISGKIGSGKDEIGKIILFLTSGKKMSYSSWLLEDHWYKYSSWQIKKYAGKLKEIISLLTGIPVADLEKQEVKDRILDEEWNKVKEYMLCGCDVVMDYSHKDGKCSNCGEPTFKETITLTVRQLLQQVGTDAMRNVIHPNVWVNALFADYKEYHSYASLNMLNTDPPVYLQKWIITDTRFPNEAEAIKNREGLLIRVNRTPANRAPILADLGQIYGENTSSKLVLLDHGKEHPSETSLDSYEGFDEVIENNGSIEELVEKVKLILIKHKII